MLHPDRLLPADPATRRVARALHDHTRALPIVSPHTHCDAATFADDAPISDPAVELVTHDHYLLRMAYSQGVPLEELGVAPLDDTDRAVDGRQVWRTFASHYHLFRGTPSRQWLDHTLGEVLGIDERLGPTTADRIYDAMCDRLARGAYRPRALYERFGIEVLATTDGALDPLEAHARLRSSGWVGRVVPTFRPDDVVDPDGPRFHTNLARLGELTGCDVSTWAGYLDALRSRRAAFIAAGATASDHGHPTAATADLDPTEADALFRRVAGGHPDPGDHERFRAQLLLEMAAMSMDDGLVLQLHAGSWRNHNPTLLGRFGRDIGADIPMAMDYVGQLKPLLDRFGNEPSLTVVVYTLDETTYSRELAPLAGHYPALRLGPPWWFFDSPDGIRRFRDRVSETAGFANTVGFNDDARSLLTIPARHDVARRVDAGYLAALVTEHRLEEDEAADLAVDLAYRLARDAFRVAS
ncbi:MAG TPA: glucuronate isomerase [Acidimicrobiales bacterium]|jgi:glucuronate isomerase|nr:glucuronate isomerase [Acidimicrobiales bacterium]